jgi:acetyl esterase/lipase
MRKNIFYRLRVFTFLSFITQHAFAQNIINIWPGAAPGSENWTQKVQTIKNTPVGTVILNVAAPTLTVYLPEKNKATDASVIVAPGGACIALAISETDELVNRLRKKGFTVFVLKYRIKEKKGEGIPKDLNEDTACQYGIADAIQSIKYVRQHASNWNISADKIGFIGFSAGGMIASEVMLQKEIALRPNFVGLIYGAPFASMPVIPASLPPIFMAWAQDDSTANYAMVRFYKALTAAGQQPETHIFNSGGHGFALKMQGTTSDHWIDELDYWLEAEGFERKE